MKRLKKLVLLLAISGPTVLVPSCSSMLLSQARDQVLTSFGNAVGDFADDILSALFNLSE